MWARLDPARALRELEAVFLPQDRTTGFVSHIHYGGAPDFDGTLWGREAVSTITQPPMYGHALRMMTERGIDIPQSLMEAAGAAIRFFIDKRGGTGLVRAVHPWETGCDDSPGTPGCTSRSAATPSPS